MHSNFVKRLLIKTISNTMEHANKDQASHFRLIKKPYDR